MSESEDYLQPDFDPTSITVPHLRSILVMHDVWYPATAKKPELITLFQDHIAQSATRILAERALARRTSTGIVDAQSSINAACHDDEEEIELPPPPPIRNIRRSRSPRKGSTLAPAPVRIKHEEGNNDLNTTLMSKHTARLINWNVPLPELEDDHSRSARRKNRRTVTLGIKDELEDEVSRPSIHAAPIANESPFSNDNPFQSGSSPPSGGIKARTKMAGADMVEQRSTPSTRRGNSHNPLPQYELQQRIREPLQFDAGVSERTIMPTRRDLSRVQKNRNPSWSSTSFQVPISQLQRKTLPITPEPDDLEPGEEFTPDEQLQLMNEVATNEKVAQSSEKLKPKSANTLVAAFGALLFVLLSAYLAWYRQEMVAAGYCGLGRDTGARLIPDDFLVPEWVVSYVEPHCQPCPKHAYCYEKLVVRCETDFVLRSHLLSFYNLVPLAPTCEPDGEKVRKVKGVADKTVEELRERRARYECGTLYDEQGKRQTSPRLEINKLKDSVASKRNKRINMEEFEDLWAAAIGDIKDRDEIETSTIANPNAPDFPDTYLSSTSLARIPFLCTIRRSIRLGLARYRLAIGSLTALMGFFHYARRRYHRHVTIKARVPSIVNTVLSRLALQRDLGDEGVDDGFLFQPHLRDDVLREIHSLREREEIWVKVKAVVEQNANVRIVQREGRNGEVGRAWEWIGPTSDAVSSQRIRSGRVSFGPDVKVKNEPLEFDEERLGHTRRSEGRRPVY